MKIFEYLENNFSIGTAYSDTFFYDDMVSQSMFSLPIIYREFDLNNISHWADRGCILDYLCALNAEGGDILDFGPGDGWPALLLAPFAGTITGIDSSAVRTEVCIENAVKLGIDNATFFHYAPLNDLPFEDASFDGITAASSIEQTPSPFKTIKELYRVLKPNGRLRINYEALSAHKDKVNDICILSNNKQAKIILYDRKIEDETVDHYKINLSFDTGRLKELLYTDELTFEKISPEFLGPIRENVLCVQKLRTIHPSGRTYINMLKEAGFRVVKMTKEGKNTAIELFMTEHKPGSLKDLDDYLLPYIKKTIEQEVPVIEDSMITAIK